MSIFIKDLCFSYAEKEVLKRVNLSVAAGETVGLVGSSGGGKSTLLKLIAGLYATQSGSIEIAGATVQCDIRANVAMVMQNAMLFPASIKENITCGHQIPDETIRHACEAAQLAEWVSTLPEGLNSFVGERGGKVSGGQAQRICIARAIAKNAPVILLDEATSALDSETSEAVLTALENLTKCKTVVTVSHRPESLSGINRIYRLDEGRLCDA